MAKNDKNIEVELVKKDVEIIKDHNKQVDTVLEQIKELAGGITRMIAIHEEKHIQHGKEASRLMEMLVQKDTERKRETEELEKKLDDTKDQLHKRMGTMEAKLMEAITSSNANQDSRLKDLEIWKWKMTGIWSVLAILGTIIINFGPIIDFFHRVIN